MAVNGGGRSRKHLSTKTCRTQRPGVPLPGLGVLLADPLGLSGRGVALFAAAVLRHQGRYGLCTDGLRGYMKNKRRRFCTVVGLG